MAKKLKQPDEAVINKLRKYWQRACKAQDTYWGTISQIENDAHEATGIDIELFHCDGSLVGIGDYGRENKLITGERFDTVDTEIKNDDD